MRSVLFSAALMLLNIFPALAQTPATVQCQNQTFVAPSGAMPCTVDFELFGPSPTPGGDLVNSWTIIGKYPMPGSKIQPWEQQEICVISIEAVKESGPPHTHIQIGNNFVPDIMVTMDSAHNRAVSETLPPGVCYPFPAKGDPAASNAYYDAHTAISAGSAQTVLWVRLTYLPEGNISATPAPPSGPVVWNTWDHGPLIALSNNNLSAAGSGSGSFNLVRATLGRSTGKFYWENVVTGVTAATSVTGFASFGANLQSYVGNSVASAGIQASGATSQMGFLSGGGSVGASWAAGDVQNFAADLDTGKAWLGKNGAWLNGGDPVSEANPWLTFTPNMNLYPAWSSSDSANSGTARFNASSFTGTVPSGYASWSGL